jgi:nucleotide-binding universal stress UspA family protein
MLAGAGGQRARVRARAGAGEGRGGWGAALAREAGFDANAVAIEGDRRVVRTLVEYIDEQRPRLVVMGTRGLTGLSAFRRR